MGRYKHTSPLVEKGSIKDMSGCLDSKNHFAIEVNNVLMTTLFVQRIIMTCYIDINMGERPGYSVLPLLLNLISKYYTLIVNVKRIS